MNVKQLCRTVPATHWLSALESWSYLSHVAALGGTGPASHPGSTVELALVVGNGGAGPGGKGMYEPPQYSECMRAAPSTHLLWNLANTFFLSIWSCEIMLELDTEGS